MERSSASSKTVRGAADTGGALRWLARRLKRHIPVVILLCVMMAAVSVLSVSMSLFMANAIDNAVGENVNLHKTFLFLGIMVGVTLGAILLRFFSKLLQTRVQQQMEITLRSSLLRSAISRDYMRVAAYHSGDVLNRLTNDTGVVAQGASSILPNVAEFVARLVFAFAILLYYDWVFAALAVGAAVLVFIGSLFLRPLLKRLHKKVQETEGNTRSFMQEVIENQLVVRVFGAEDRVMQRTDELQHKGFLAAMRRRLVTVGAGEGVTFMFTLGTLAALCWGTLSLAGVFGPEKAITYGTLAAVLQLVNQVQTPFAKLSGVLPQFFAMTASCERIMEVEQLPAEPGSEEGACTEEQLAGFAGIDFNGVSFSYRKRDDGERLTVLDNASARVDRGDFIAITGISGIGKSTLMKLMMGVYKPESGSIDIDLGEFRHTADAATRGLFAYVPQGNLLLSGTVKENITFLREDVADGDIERACYIACADEFIKELPNGLNTRIGEHGLGLSEGQAQRLAVARAVLTKAPVLLLDEATSALDAATEERLLTRLKGSECGTVFIVTHKPAALDICNKELRITDGRIELYDSAH